MSATQQYNELKPKILKAIAWLEDPARTKGEFDKWFPKFKQMFDEATRLERLMRNENLRRGI